MWNQADEFDFRIMPTPKPWRTQSEKGWKKNQRRGWQQAFVAVV